MKDLEVIAYHGQGPDRTFAGKKTVKIPTTLAEAGRMPEWGEERTLARAVGSYVIEVQRSLRGPKSMSEQEKAFKKLSPAKQAKILKLLAAEETPAPKARKTVKKRKAGSSEVVNVTPPTGGVTHTDIP